MSTEELSKKEMIEEALKYASHVKMIYSSRLAESIYGPLEKLPANLAVSMISSGVKVEEFGAFRSWFMSGLRPFAEYPPAISQISQLSKLLRVYPSSNYSKSMSEFWYKLDTDFGQRYGKFWRGDGPIETLTKERVWLAQFEAGNYTEKELYDALLAINDSGCFSIYPPSLEQFVESIRAAKCSAPIPEKAWIIVQSIVQDDELHPAIRRAKGLVGAYDLRVYGFHKNIEQRFMDCYKSVIRSFDTQSYKSISGRVGTIEYETSDALAELFSLKN